MNLSLSERSVVIERQGVSLFTRVTGQGKPLMLLHGFSGSSESWGEVTRELSTGSLVIRPDLIGHGRSTAPPDPARYTMEQAAEDIIAILDSLEIHTVSLHGYSMGGRLALYTSIRYPNRIISLSLESASPGLRSADERKTRQASDNALAHRIIAAGLEAFVHEWEQIPLFATQSGLSPHVLEKQRQLRMANNPEGLAGSLRGMGTGIQPNLWPRLHELQIPALLLTGALDAKFTDIAKQMAGLLPNAQHHVVPHCGHSIYLERPESWVTAVRAFISGQESHEL